jgi:3D (Asp-Asp-Asp) domain-containing protein
MANSFSITLYPPDGSTQQFTATNYAFQEGGRLHFTESGTNKQYVTTLPYLVQPA